MSRWRAIVVGLATTVVLAACAAAAMAVVREPPARARTGSPRGAPGPSHAAPGPSHAALRRGARRASATARAVGVLCPSPSLGGTLPAEVYLPAGYSTRAAPYPVIYFLHGLPAGPTTYTTNGFVARALAAAHQRAIVVAPQGARSAGSDREYLDWSPSENWPAAIADDLPACIDSRFNTIANRWGRALMGLSAGGYGAFNIGLRNLQSFAAVESWSGYFVATDPSGEHVLNLGSPAAQTAATVPQGAGLRAALGSWPAFIGFYVGNQDARFLQMNVRFDAALRRGGITHVFRIYPGGHTGALWRAHARLWLTWALRYLAAGRARQAGQAPPGPATSVSGGAPVG